jgi:hypothetical protein
MDTLGDPKLYELVTKMVVVVGEYLLDCWLLLIKYIIEWWHLIKINELSYLN